MPTVAIAPIVTGSGGSPGSSGSSLARASASLISDLDGLRAAARGVGAARSSARCLLLRLPTYRLPVEGAEQFRGCGARIVGALDRAHHDDPARAGLHHDVD